MLDSMILIENKQNKVPVDCARMQKSVEQILENLSYSDFSIAVIFCTDDQMQEYNLQFRKKDQPTDILSFPFYPDHPAGTRIKARNKDEKILGDIIIAPFYVLNDLDRWQQTLEDRLKTLLVHGICHLLGYDHILDKDYAVMHKEEKRLLDLL